jgi:N-acetylglucosaminyldiphosphoundecaprenol N-acetyl-beta-D-mannosaminyltransferase
MQPRGGTGFPLAVVQTGSRTERATDAHSSEREPRGGMATGRRPMLTTSKRQDASHSLQSAEQRPAAHGERPESEEAAAVSDLAWPDDLSREVYCILGVPIDAIGMLAVLRRIEAAARRKTRLLISTPNLNMFVTSQSDGKFRESLVLSDLCTVDGMPIVWIARLAGVPIKSRTAGSDIFDALRDEVSPARSLKIFLFGGPEGVAEMAALALNSQPGGVKCVGWSNPGFCSAEEMSRDDIIDHINSSGADFLVAALGSQKGQLWLQRNHHRLRIPVRAHLGATLNFQAGTIRREPYLWRRYWNDGRVMLRLLFTRVLPFAFWTWWLRLRHERREDLIISHAHGPETITLSLSGPADAQHVDSAIPAFRDATASRKQVTLDFSNVRAIDARFLGLLLMLKKKLKSDGAAPRFTGVSPLLERIFYLGGLNSK